MPDFRIDDTASEHPKMRAAGLAAFGLWSAAGSWCMNPAHLTDGWVPVHYVQGWDGGKKSAKKLVEVGLWHDETRDGIPGYRYHDWADFQRTRKAIEDEKRKAKDRMARIRSGNVRPNTPRTSDERSPNVHDSLTLTQSLTPGEGSRGEVPEGDASARERPPERCSRHILEANPPPCGACADARRTLETWTRQRTTRVHACRLCDGDGRRWHPAGKHRGTTGACDHQPAQAEAS